MTRERDKKEEEQMNKQKSQVKVSKVFVFITKPLNTVNIFPTIQPLEINSHLSLVNALPIN